MDPFKKMTFDPELCYTMNCDYYLFNIELKCKSFNISRALRFFVKLSK